jgi:hypothetical protein
VLPWLTDGSTSSFNSRIIYLMNRKICVFICFCIGAGMLAAYLHRPIKNSVVVSNNVKDLTVYSPAIAVAAISSVAKPTFVQTQQDSNSTNSMAATEQTSESAPAQDGKESAVHEKYRLLRSLRAWAAKDPEAALAAAMKLPEGDERNQALSAVCLGLAQTDPADAVKMAQTLNLGNQPGGVMESLVQQWAATDLASVLDWANSQPAGYQRDGFTTRIAYVMSQSDPAGAANLVLNQISPGPAQDEAVMTVLNQWGNQNLVAATTWVKGFPEGPLQARAVNELEGIANYQHQLGH